MIGVVNYFNRLKICGKILGNDGKMYTFSKACINRGNYINHKCHVEFDPDVTNNGSFIARNIRIFIDENISYERLEEEQIEQIKEAISHEIQEKGFLAGACFPKVLKKANVYNFHNYAKNISKFIDCYFSSDFEVKPKILIGGKTYPCVIVPVGGVNSLDTATTVDVNTISSEVFENNIDFDVSQLLFGDENKKELDKLYSEERYFEFLTSPYFCNVQPCDMPIEYIKKALTCAKRLLLGVESSEVILNGFQKALITMPTGIEFINKYKVDGKFILDIFEGCRLTIFPKRKDEAVGKEVNDALNAIGTLAGTLVNNNYANLSKRASVCWNEIFPYLHLICLLNLNPKNAEKRITKICTMVKASLKFKTDKSNIKSDTELALYLPNILKILKSTNRIKEFSTAIQINVASVFADMNRIDLASDMANILTNSIISDTLSMQSHYDDFSEERISNIIQNGNRQLFQKICAIIWDSLSGENVLSIDFLRVLSYVIKYDCSESLDEIIRLSYSRKYSKKQKQISLFNSYNVIVNALHNEPTMFNLGTYIYSLLKNMNAQTLDNNIIEMWSQWTKISGEYYDMVTSKCYPITKETSNAVRSLFSTFMLDIDKENSLQNDYAEWIIGQITSNCESADKCAKRLPILRDYGAYDAYRRVYFYIQKISENKYNLSEYIDYLISSLCRLNLYSEAIHYLKNIDITKKMSNALLLKVVTSVCFEYGLSSKTLYMFSDNFTIQNATELLISNYNGTNVAVINSLMVLYILQKESFKAFYLYSIFSEKCRIGYDRIYSQIHSWCSLRYNNLFKSDYNHYVVLFDALNYLSPDEMMDLVQWAGRIAIPDFDWYSPQPTLINRLLDSIIGAPNNKDTWYKLYEHLLKFPEKNAWQICSIESVFYTVFGEDHHGISEPLTEKYLKEVKSSEFAYNYISVSMYIYNLTRSETIFRLLLDRITNEEEMRKKVVPNDLTISSARSVDTFGKMCLKKFEETGDGLYCSLMEALGVELEMPQISKINGTNDSKRIILNKLCENYFNLSKREESIETIKKFDSFDMNFQERCRFDTLKFLYTENEVVIDNNVYRFTDENEIIRFKRDVATVLLDYPSRKGLETFEYRTTSLKYRLQILSLVFNCLYDENIWKRYETIPYEQLIKENAFDEYFLLCHKTYLAQLYYNSDFDPFYISNRYQKAVTALLVLSHHNIVLDDDIIIKVMNSNDHFKGNIQSNYEHYKSQIIDFIVSEQFNLDFKRSFVYSLLSGNWEYFIDNKLSECRFISDNTLLTMGLLIQTLCYREFNTAILKAYIEAEDKDFLDSIMTFLHKLYNPVYDVVLQLSIRKNNDDFTLVSKILYAYSPSKRVNEILDFPADSYKTNRDLLVPLAASVQFNFKIYVRLRDYIKRNEYDNRWVDILNYLQKYYSESASVEQYLRCLQYAMHADRATALKYFNYEIFKSKLPVDWIKEVEYLNNYLYSTGEKPFNILKISGGTGNTPNNYEIDFKLVKELAQKVGIEDIESNAVEKSEINFYNDFCAAKSVDKQIKCGLRYLILMQRNKGDKTKTKEYEFIYDWGNACISSESGFNADEKLRLIIDLYSNIAILSVSMRKSYIDNYFNRIRSILREGISLKQWCKFANSIFDIIYDINVSNRDEVSKIRDEIIPMVIDATSNQIPLDERIKRLSSISFQGFQSDVFVGYLSSAINAEVSELKKSSALVSIKYENVENVTDNYIYFCLENVGEITVNFGNAVVEVKFTGGIYERVMVNNIYELHPGLMTGLRKKLPENTPEKTTVIARVRIGDMILTEATAEIHISNDIAPLHLSDDAHYITEQAMIEDSLVGRINEKNKISKSLKSGITVIYGPSRIGKTSLLNWVRLQYSKDYVKLNQKDLGIRKVITILLGGENEGKRTDYEKNFHTKQMLDYCNDEDISQYLLVDSILGSLDKKRRCFVSDGSRGLNQSIASGISGILSNDAYNVVDKVDKLDELLGNNDTELWLLLDEFQQVIDKWKNPKLTCSFAEVCEMLHGYENKHYLKIVFCGSDDLLKHMACVTDSRWRSIIGSRGVPIKALYHDEFKEMIFDEKSIKDSNLTYSPNGFEALYSYTGGIALYGKEICNAILQSIRTDSSYFEKRSTIYTYDISLSMQGLLNKQNDDQKNKIKFEGIIGIYSDVTNNLKPSDMLILQYISEWLFEHPEEKRFPKSLLVDRELIAEIDYPNYLDDLIKVAVARGIISENEEDNYHHMSYTFTTLFYYYAFLGQNKKSCIELEEMIFINEVEDSDLSSESDMDTKQEFAIKYKGLNSDEQVDILKDLYSKTDFKDSKQLNDFKEKVGVTKYIINQGKYVEGDDNSRNISINIQNMVNSFNQILAGAKNEELLVALEGIPQLDSYYNNGSLTSIMQRVQNGDQEAEDLLVQGTDKMVSDYQTALLQQNDDEFCVWDVLGLKKDKYNYLSQKVLPNFMLDLFFAAKLETIFAIIDKDETIQSDKKDFSPVSIMYCKIVEKMLKYYHTDIYQKRLPNSSTEQKYKGSKVKFGEMNNPIIRNEVKNRITLGAFLYPINPNYSHDESFDALATTDDEKNDWKAHGIMLDNVRKIRNKSAHGESGSIVDSAMLFELKKWLFKNEGLVNIVLLCE